MDSMIAAAARALASGDALAALKLVALREDAPALALRGIAMAQLEDYPRARDLLKRAARALTAAIEARQLPPALLAVADLSAAEIALRLLETKRAQGALERAAAASGRAGFRRC